QGPSNRTLTIFKWSQQTFMHGRIPWKDYNKELCSFHPELQSFFDAYWRYHVNDDTLKWPTGFAPCWLWDINGNDNSLHLCNNGIQYKITSDYSKFHEADIVFMDYVF